ncbi:hypothetical protein [Streptomyces sp. WM6378]|uniref:hypothetical protein n=2 Tax=Streptomyces TaxID=1883 RepID=UPI00131C76AC|nr:hypothetical protein [Streptomyces sp. WM6378]
MDQALNLLFKASTGPSGKEYTNKQVADDINERAGRKAISDETIRKLRHEGSPSPSLDKVSLLADFFHVPLDYFRTGKIQEEVIGELKKRLHQKEEAERQRKAQEAERERPDEHVQFLARTFDGLTPMSQGQVLGFIKGLEEAQKAREQQDGG